MKPTRRDFIKTIACGVIGKGLISTLPLDARAKTEEFPNGIELEKGYLVFNGETQKTMEAIADTLLPGAKELGIRTRFMEYMSKDHGLAGFLDAGFWNLDAISKLRFKRPYYRLESEKEKKIVLKHVYARNPNFINLFKNQVIKIYYSTASVWKKLSYGGPPQPRGFMDYTQPPK
jgi:hypothetical protein